jgi:L-malate glycosyltransferase
MKIGIACYPTVGGSGILATELGYALANRGHQVHFLAYADLARTPTQLGQVHVHRVEVSAYPLFKYPPYDLALACKMGEVANAFDLDVLHVHYAIPHALCAYLARRFYPSSRSAVVLTLHGTDITVVGNDPAYRTATRFGIDQADAVVAVSDYLRKETQRIFQPTKEIGVVPNFVDTARFRVDPSIDSSELPSIAHLSNFRPVKRPLDVVHAFSNIRRSIPSTLNLIGDGPELPRCMALARELGIAAHVNALGVLSAPEIELAKTHLLLQPSGSESFGLAALEAMACGVPVVGYRVGGLPEVVVSGETGYLVDFADVSTLAERSIDILGNPALWRAFRNAARTRAVTHYSLEKSVSTHEALYRSVARLAKTDD